MGFDETWLEKLLKHNPDIKIHKQPKTCNMQEENKIKKSKYGNKRVKVDGILFDSQKEADYYCDLKLMLKYGFILGFSIQCKFILQEGDEKIKPICYIADFVVFYKDRTVIIDTKGVRTDVYKLKKKMFEKKFGMKIIEV